MAVGATYPAVIKNANGDETQGIDITFTDSENQPTGDQVPFQPESGEVVVIVEDAAGDPVYDYDDDSSKHEFEGDATLSGQLVTGSFSSLGAAQFDGDIDAGAVEAALADLSLVGLPGAVAGGRYVGFTATVAPTTGDFLVGDVVISLNGSAWVCTVAGSPGTWVALSSVLLAPKAAPTFTGHVTIPQATAVLDAVPLNQVSSALTITSGTLPNMGAWVSGTAKVNPVTRDITVNVECVFDGTANAATVLIAVSSDDTTYTTVGTPGVSAAINTVGGLTQLVPVSLPKGWFIKLTIAAHASVAASVYY